MFSVLMEYLDESDEVTVIKSSTGTGEVELTGIMDKDELLAYQDLILTVEVPAEAVEYIVDLVSASRPENGKAPDFVREYVAWGAGLRASHYLVLAGKARAVLDGRLGVSVADIQAVAMPVLRHRIITNFKAEAARMRPEHVIERLLESVPKPSSGL